MKQSLVGTAAAFGLVFLVGMTLAVVINTSVNAVVDAQTVINSPGATGDLTILKSSTAQIIGVSPGDPITYSIYYSWNGDDAAPNVTITDEFPDEVAIAGIFPPPTQQGVNTLEWDIGTLQMVDFGFIVITGTVRPDVPVGRVFTNTVTIAGDVTDQDLENNTSHSRVEIPVPLPDLQIWKLGMFEEIEEGFGFTAEEGVETTFNLFYANYSSIGATGTVLTDDLPSGIAFVSADPPPSHINGQQLTWDLGEVPSLDAGEIVIIVRPEEIGAFVNTASIGSSVDDRQPSDNSFQFSFNVVTLLPPRLLRPNTRNIDEDRPVIVNANPHFAGLAKTGATVTLYEGDADGCYGDLANCHPTEIISTVAGLDRSWEMTPTTMTETRTYSLYLRAELGSIVSEAPWGYWMPMPVRVDPAFANWDMDNFTISTEGQENSPGGLGGTTGIGPNAPFTITIRQSIWPSVPSSPTLSALHDLRLVIDEGMDEPYTVTLPVTEFRSVPTNTLSTGQSVAAPLAALDYMSYDLFYVQHGFGPGAHVHVWCRPVYYPDDPDDLPIVGLVWTLCNELLIDPAGYVYDVNTAGGAVDWPDIPPSASLVTNATVTATVRTGDDTWARWQAELSGQVNPQTTDESKNDRIDVPGYYAFYVPPGQYRVEAAANGCARYTSPILTVVDAPIFHNVGMRCSSAAQIGVSYDAFLPAIMHKKE